MREGAFTNPQQVLRQQALDIAVEGCRVAADLGSSELIVWSPYDGYDYFFQVRDDYFIQIREGLILSGEFMSASFQWGMVTSFN
jgi:L-rhamnose isomerase